MMESFAFDESARSALESSVVPMGIYQVVNGRVVTLMVSDGLCELFGYESRAAAIEMLDRDRYWNVHPVDLDGVVAQATTFIDRDEPYNLFYRARSKRGYRLVHARGRRLSSESDPWIGIVWYIDEGAAPIDATSVADVEQAQESVTPLHALLGSMPAITYLKSVEDGRYLACSPLFAELAGKKGPEGVVGCTDYEVFGKGTADLVSSSDRTALSADEPLSFFENVTDASGNPRRLQTTKQKFVDELGRLCVLGIAVDVTEMMAARDRDARSEAAYQEALSASAAYGSIVKALARDYFNLYYVDTVTDEYIEYGSRTEQGRLTTERRGTDFFEECRRNADGLVYAEDLDQVIEALSKERLIAEVERRGTYVCHYRILLGGTPTFVSLKATRIPGDNRHVIIGISNEDAQMRDHMAAERAVEDHKSYLRLSAFAGNLTVLYCVDPVTNEYTEFSASTSFESLGIAKNGTDFFGTSYENGKRTIHPDDLELFHTHVTKENVLSTIERDGVFILDYRLVTGGLPTYVRLKAAMVEEDDKDMLLVGLLDEDAQIRQEREYVRNLSAAREMAVIDSLTGVKNKHAYAEWEERINAAIRRGEQEPFAVVVCDVNGLKSVNDLYGHKEGDICIKKACTKICHVFEHSPVFRVGGDEFAVILTQGDYVRRAQLMEWVIEVPKDRDQIGMGETIAAGIADYQKGVHPSLLSVFEEADKAMYERKRLMKDLLAPQGKQPADEATLERIPAFNMRRKILVADDVEMQREILGDLLEDDYDIIYARDGVEALEKLHAHKDDIALVLLDLYMPRMTGREVIAEMQVDDDLMSIPVIFLTVDQDAELDCLRIGAMDFIPKPYPDIEIVKARISKCIELSEDRDLIRHTERDRLTGLLNKEYFFRYVERLDRIHDDEALDALACDVNRLHAINEQYGRQFGDHVLHSVGAGIRRLARQTDGIGCREGGDTFLLYCPHQRDYEELIATFTSEVFVDEEMARRVSLRFGVFNDARQEPDVEERFVRAKSAANSVKHNPQRSLAYYAYRSPVTP